MLRAVAMMMGLVAVLMAGCDKEKTATHAKPALPVTVYEVDQRTVPILVRSVGTFKANQIATLSAQLPGTLTDLGFEDGAVVKQGDPIATLDTTVQKADYESAKADADEKKWVYDAKAKMYETGAATEYEVTLAKLQMQTSISARDSEKATLDKLVVLAPFDGRLSIHLPDVGDYLDAGTNIVTLVNDKPMEIDYDVPDSAVPKLAVGQSVMVHDKGEKLAEGKVTAFGPMINPQTRTMRVRAQFANEDSSLVSGGFISVNHKVGEKAGASVIPQEAIVQTEIGPAVYVIDGEAAKRQMVKLGQYFDDLVVVDDGLKPGQQIVLRGWHKLADGAKVKVVPALKNISPAGPTESTKSSSTKTDEKKAEDASR